MDIGKLALYEYNENKKFKRITHNADNSWSEYLLRYFVFKKDTFYFNNLPIR